MDQSYQPQDERRTTRIAGAMIPMIHQFRADTNSEQTVKDLREERTNGTIEILKQYTIFCINGTFDRHGLRMTE